MNYWRLLIACFAIAFVCNQAWAQQAPREGSEAVGTVQPISPVAEDQHTQITAATPLVVDAISATVAQTVSDRLSKRQDFYWSVAGGVGTVLIGFFGFLGLGQIQNMRKQISDGLLVQLQEQVLHDESFRASVEETVRQKLLVETREQMRSVKEQVALNRLASLAAKVEAGTGFSDNEKDALIEGLLVLKDSGEITASGEFKESLRNVVKSFQAADLDLEIDQIHERLGPVVLERLPQVSVGMMLSYAFRVLGGATSTIVDRERFLRYAAALKRLKWYEHALPYLFVAVDGDKLKDVVAPKFADLKLDFQYLRDDEKQQCANFIFNYASDRAYPTARHERLCNAFQSFVGKHGQEFARWRTKAPEETQ